MTIEETVADLIIKSIDNLGRWCYKFRIDEKIEFGVHRLDILIRGEVDEDFEAIEYTEFSIYDIDLDDEFDFDQKKIADIVEKKYRI